MSGNLNQSLMQIANKINERRLDYVSTISFDVEAMCDLYVLAGEKRM